MNADPDPVVPPDAKKRVAVPRGVIVLGLLLYIGAIASAAVAVAIPASMLAGVPRWVFLLGTLALTVLATGLFRRRRWAWYAALSFVAINAYYLLLGTAQRGQNTIVGATLLAAVAAYLLWPGVRGAFLKR